jgi:hypothetical protein
MKVRLVLAIAVTFCVAYPWQRLAAEEQELAKPQAKSVSPDGKWELRTGAAGEQDDFVISKAGSAETSLVLSEEEYIDGLAEAMGRAPGYANIVWAPDSKRFAFNLQPGKGFQTAQIYQLDGDKWRKLQPPESHDAMTAPVDRSLTNQKKKVKEKWKLSADDWGWPVMTSWQFRKWVGPSTALIYARRSAKFDVKDGTEEVNVSFFFTLKFDSAGNWKVTRKFEVPAIGVGGLDAEERKEIIRIENEDREVRGK